MERCGRIPEILMVEDNPGDVLLTRRAFESAKLANVLNVVTDGAQAMAYLRKQGEYQDRETPGIVLLDLNLPRKSGREVLEEIKGDPELKHIPVVVLTSSKDHTDILKSYQNYANSYIVKPVSMDNLVEVIATLEAYWMAVVTLPQETAG